MTEKLWITWEKQRRSTVLSKEFGAELHTITAKSRGYFRYFIPILKTTLLLLRTKPKYVFCQNPSIVLAALICFLKPAFNYSVIVDRHTNFKLAEKLSKNPKWIIFRCLSNYSLKRSDYTIVTNRYLKILCKDISKRTFVLPDKIPDFSDIGITANFHQSSSGISGISGIFICTFADDEPFELVIDAARLVPNIKIKITGNYRKSLTSSQIEQLPKNVVLLGYVSDEEYFRQIQISDFTIVLTKNEFTLNCGAYESLAFGKPMLLSNTKTIKDYFSFGSIYTDHDSAISIANRLLELEKNIVTLSLDIEKKLPEKKQLWQENFQMLASRLFN
jgi:glycosyltransferase involved in cell wall biosynthesis